MSVLSQEKVPVTIDGQNVIYIRPKMTLGMQTRIADGLKMHRNGSGMQIGIGEGEALILLLTETVVGWEGPDFEDDGAVLPLNRVTLESLPADYPLLDQLKEKVTAMYINASGEGTSPNLPKPKRSGRNTSRP